jgi:hypothetical protein
VDKTQATSLSDVIAYGWPYAGLALAAVILAVLLSRPSPTDKPYAARFSDPAWLVWAAVPMYMLHQFEEHGIDLLGHRYHFLGGLCETLGHKDLATCPGDPWFILAVNVTLTWFAGPLSGVLASRQRLYLGATFLCTPLINAFAHIMPGLLKGQYNPGLLTSVLLFLPFCLHALRLMRKQGILDGPRLVSIPLLGVLLHAVLLASLKATEAGLISHAVRDLLQVLNAFVPLAVASALERALGARLAAA